MHFMSVLLVLNILLTLQSSVYTRNFIEPNGASVVIHVDAEHNKTTSRDDTYLLDYSPMIGSPPPKSTFRGSLIEVSNLKPATTYEFKLYQLNNTLGHKLVFHELYTTEPDPPKALYVSVLNSTSAVITFSPPVTAWTHFNLMVTGLSEIWQRNITLNNTDPFNLRDLTPGGIYQINLITLFKQKASSKSKEYVFTTRPEHPEKLIAYDRNETSLFILVNRPSTVSIYSHFIITIGSMNTTRKEVIINKDASPTIAVFQNLVSGKLYKVCAQTANNDTVSEKICQQYHTIPLPPTKLKVVPESVGINHFSLSWHPPTEPTVFNKYQVSIDLQLPNPITPIYKCNHEECSANFSKHLVPGHTYQVNVTTVSGKAISKPAIITATLRPLEVMHLKAFNKNGQPNVIWITNDSGYQDSFEVSYAEVINNTIFTGDSNSVYTTNHFVTLDSLLPGRNYSISVKALSNNVTSDPAVYYFATNPSVPNIEDLKLIEYGFNISWKTEVDSQQDHFEIVVYSNNTDDIQPLEFRTNNRNYIIQQLYPGETYRIEIYAVSHGIRSQPHDLTQTVLPKPPRNASKTIFKDSLVLKWACLPYSLYSGFSIRIKTADSKNWKNFTTQENSFSMPGKLIAGEQYLILINTISQGVESAHPLTLSHVISPNPIHHIHKSIAATNVTFDIRRPEGRVDYYVINWMDLDENEQTNQTLKKINGTGVHGDAISIVIDNLMPGATYLFSMYTLSYDLQSETTNYTTQTKPVIESKLKVVTDGPEKNSLIVEYTPTINCHFNKYQFRLSSPGLTQEKNRFDRDMKVTFLNLVPGQLYTITAWTISGQLSSSPICLQERLNPSPVSQVNISSITNTSAILSWLRPMNSEVSAYEIKIFSSGALFYKYITTADMYFINNLKPYSNYTADILVRAGNESSILKISNPVSTFFQTSEGIPGLVRDFQYIEILPRQITFDWKFEPNETNGILTKFTITCIQEESSDIRTIDVNATKRRVSLRDLTPGREYSFKIKAATKVGYGPEASFVKIMPVSAPPKPGSHAIPLEVSHSSTTIQIRFQKDFFSDENGQVRKYTIIVAEDNKRNTSELRLPRWGEVQGSSLWPPYQVMEPYYPFNYSNVEEYTIGEDKSCVVNRSSFCNGPLKQGAVYHIKIRAFTTDKDFIETDYSLPIQTDQNQLALCIAFLLPAVFFLLLIFGNLLLKKIRSRHTDETNIYQLSNVDQTMITSKPVRIERFADYCEAMSAYMNIQFSEEFKKLEPVGKDQACTVGKEFRNRLKNRFSNIVPYDHNRFKLQSIEYLEGSDYINASYISGYNSMKEYIVTQGPLPGTKDDFWRMCWESNTRVIVMLTKCIEEGKLKCDRYWPEDTESVYYGNICLKNLNQKFHQDWCITKLNVRKGNDERIIQHFHFTSWPVFGVPKDHSTLVGFIRTFRENILNEPIPIIVHCSAGVGRSGTFIAIDHALLSIQHGHEEVDIFGLLYQMRKERMFMVQTEQQYITVHKCVLYFLNGRKNAIPQIDEIYDNITFEDDEGIGESGI